MTINPKENQLTEQIEKLRTRRKARRDRLLAQANQLELAGETTRAMMCISAAQKIDERLAA